MSNSPFRTAVLGLTHDHVWDHLPDILAADRIELVGAAEPDAERRDKFRRELSLPAVENYAELLDDESLEAVWIFADNRRGAELAEQAAQRRLHVLIEKPMADCLLRADRMLAAACSSGTRLMINWPFAWWPQLQHALRMAADGAVGEVWQVRYRAAHAGPKELGCSDAFCQWLFDPQRNGPGGALMDYCCYGALLASIVLGPPSRVTGVAGRLTKHELCVEDNALVVMEYSGAMAVAEGSWSQVGKLGSYVTMIYGRRGTLLVEPRAGGRLLLADAETPEGREVELPPADPALACAASHFQARLADGLPFQPLSDPAHARAAQEILEAAWKSVQTGAAVSLPLR